MQNKEHILKLRNCYYCFTDRRIEEHFLYYAANARIKVVEPCIDAGNKNLSEGISLLLEAELEERTDFVRRNLARSVNAGSIIESGFDANETENIDRKKNILFIFTSLC